MHYKWLNKGLFEGTYAGRCLYSANGSVTDSGSVTRTVIGTWWL